MEEVDRKAADETYRGLNAAGESLTALFFQQERVKPFHTLETAIETARSRAREAEAEIAKHKKDVAADQAAHRPGAINRQYQPPKEYSDAFRGNQYVTVARKELPPEIAQYLPILDKGLAKAASSGFQTGKRIADRLTK